MTTDATPANSDADKSETALVPKSDSGIDPFIAAAKSETAAPPRGLAARLLDYSAHAAIIVGLVGFAWTVSSHLGANPTTARIDPPAQVAKVEAPKPVEAPKAVEAPKKVDELAELRQANSQMASDIKSLRANLDQLRANVHQDKTSGEVHALEADLKSVKSGLTSAKSETEAALAQLSGKVDKLQHEPTSKMQQLVDRLGRLESQGTDKTSTGSLGHSDETNISKAVPTPPTKPATIKAATAEETPKDSKPQVLTSYVVRDVYDGVALIEGKRGTIEVVPGVSIPGAGVVRSIERHGNGWTVTTSKGLLAYAAPPRDYRRIDARRFYDEGPGGY